MSDTLESLISHSDPKIRELRERVSRSGSTASRELLDELRRLETTLFALSAFDEAAEAVKKFRADAQRHLQGKGDPLPLVRGVADAATRTLTVLEFNAFNAFDQRLPKGRGKKGDQKRDSELVAKEKWTVSLPLVEGELEAVLEPWMAVAPGTSAIVERIRAGLESARRSAATFAYGTALDQLSAVRKDVVALRKAAEKSLTKARKRLAVKGGTSPFDLADQLGTRLDTCHLPPARVEELRSQLAGWRGKLVIESTATAGAEGLRQLAADLEKEEGEADRDWKSLDGRVQVLAATLALVKRVAPVVTGYGAATRERAWLTARDRRDLGAGAEAVGELETFLGDVGITELLDGWRTWDATGRAAAGVVRQEILDLTREGSPGQPNWFTFADEDLKSRVAEHLHLLAEAVKLVTPETLRDWVDANDLVGLAREVRKDAASARDTFAKTGKARTEAFDEIEREATRLGEGLDELEALIARAGAWKPEEQDTLRRLLGFRATLSQKRRDALALAGRDPGQKAAALKLLTDFEAGLPDPLTAADQSGEARDRQKLEGCAAAATRLASEAGGAMAEATRQAKDDPARAPVQQSAEALYRRAADRVDAARKLVVGDIDPFHDSLSPIREDLGKLRDELAGFAPDTVDPTLVERRREVVAACEQVLLLVDAVEKVRAKKLVGLGDRRSRLSQIGQRLVEIADVVGRLRAASANAPAERPLLQNEEDLASLRKELEGYRDGLAGTSVPPLESEPVTAQAARVRKGLQTTRNITRYRKGARQGVLDDLEALVAQIPRRPYAQTEIEWRALLTRARKVLSDADTDAVTDGTCSERKTEIEKLLTDPTWVGKVMPGYPATAKDVVTRKDAAWKLRKTEGKVLEAHRKLVELEREIRGHLELGSDDVGVQKARAETLGQGELRIVTAGEEAEKERLRYEGRAAVLEKELERARKSLPRNPGTTDALDTVARLAKAAKNTAKAGNHASATDMLEAAWTRLRRVVDNGGGDPGIALRRIPDLVDAWKRDVEELRSALGRLVEAIGEAGADPAAQKAVREAVDDAGGLVRGDAFDPFLPSLTRESAPGERLRAREGALAELRRAQAAVFSDKRLRLLAGNPFAVELRTDPLARTLLDLERNLLMAVPVA